MMDASILHWGQMQAVELLSFAIDLAMSVDGGEGPGNFDPATLPPTPPLPTPEPLPITPPPTVPVAEVTPVESIPREPVQASGGPTWGDFQSLVQISIALNAAYFSIGQFFSPDATLERSKIVSLRKGLESYRSNRPDRGNYDGLSVKIYDLMARVSGLEEIDRIFFHIFRPVSVVAFFVGVGMLIYSSLYAIHPISAVGLICILILLLPFCVGIVYAVLVSQLGYAPVSRARSALVKEVDKSYLAKTKVAQPSSTTGSTEAQ